MSGFAPDPNWIRPDNKGKGSTRSMKMSVCFGILVAVIIILAVSGILVQDPKFSEGDVVCINGREVVVTYVCRLIGGVQYSVYDNGLRSSVWEPILEKCGD